MKNLATVLSKFKETSEKEITFVFSAWHWNNNF